MGKKLIIVESPTKIKTLKKFLGSNYVFESSLGHIRDLPQKGFGIDTEHDFEPQYVTLPDKKEVIEKLKKSAKECDTVYLSPDPDREGEAIAWHIASILPSKTNIQRATFNSITKEAVIEALNHPRQIDMGLVNAQQARRLLDRIVGYKISPFLNRRVQRGKNRDGFLSAGRVQSVALKLVVDREKEIEAFKPIEYWTLSVLLATEKELKQFRAYLYSVSGKRVEKELIEGKKVITVSTKETADDLILRLQDATYWVSRVERKEKKRNPVPPFITSTLQQEASRHYNFSSSRTMKIAQELYEGVEIGNNGPEGLITYMRTDSVRIAPEALTEVRRHIESTYGKEFLPNEARVFSSKKSAQDAHEAIRPANLLFPPQKIKSFLSRDQFLIYELIWKRFVSSQMNPAIYDTVSADISTDREMLFRATGSTLKFAGFLAAYEEKVDEEDKDNEMRILPPLEEGDPLKKIDLDAEQSFTKPPARFTEASLVKELEKSGIGRPSTYATIMNKIQSREYTTKENHRLKPTELGRVIAQMLEANFQTIMSIGFTAEMEETLERIAENQADWKEVIRKFWGEFIPTLEIAEKEGFVPKVLTDIPCPKCGSKLQKIWSHAKYFYGCSAYPECDYSITAEELSFNKEDYDPDFNWEQACPKCGAPMKVRHGRFGAFLGCTRYPECKGIVNIPKKGELSPSTEALPSCPAIGCDGHIVARKSRFGKTFYSCSNYPDCDVIVNQIDQLNTKYADHPKTAYVKKSVAKAPSKKAPAKTATRKTKTTAPKKEPKKRAVAQSLLTPSPELAPIVGSQEITRKEVLQNVWKYIKEHNLQDPKNKKTIIPDRALSQLFGNSDPIDMFKLPGILNAHLHKKE